MRRFIAAVFSLIWICLPVTAAVRVGTAHCEITPLIGTPSAGYAQRKGEGMHGVHDPLLATAVLIQTEEKKLVFCAVDHLGFDAAMVREIKERVQQQQEFAHCEIFVSSSHTHSGGGAFMDWPIVGEMLAGPFDPKIRAWYIEQTAQAILSTARTLQPAKIGWGTGSVAGISRYRDDPHSVFDPSSGKTPPHRLHVLKITTLQEDPLCVLFNFPLHPTTLGSSNYLFSADFIWAAREELYNTLGKDVACLYINGAQAEIVPEEGGSPDEWETCNTIGKKLAKTVLQVWEPIKTCADVTIQTKHVPYQFAVAANPFGWKIPIDTYASEINKIVFIPK